MDEGFKRVRFEGIEVEELEGGGCRATVEMEWGSARYTGTAEEGPSELRDARCGGRAATQAIARLVAPSGAQFDLLDLELVKVLNSNAVVVAMAVANRGVTRYSVGFCVIRDDAAGAAVRAVLNGTNRFLSQILDTRAV